MSGPHTVLIVQPDAEGRAAIRDCLRERSLVTREATSAQEAVAETHAKPPDLVILDLDLPDQSGLGLTRRLRESPELARLPIMVVSSKASEMDRILAFEAGVDDFLAKPFYAPELAARVAAVLRRSTGPAHSSPQGPLRLGNMRIDATSGRVTIGSRHIDLTPKELDLLIALAEVQGRVVPREELLQKLWGKQSSERTVDAHIKSIRRKLGPSRGCIETVRGVGYRFSETPPA